MNTKLHLHQGFVTYLCFTWEKSQFFNAPGLGLILWVNFSYNLRLYVIYWEFSIYINNFSFHDDPDNFSTNIALSKINTLPLSSTHSMPPSNNVFSQQFTYMYEISISHYIISTPFSSVMININIMVYTNTGASVMSPPAINWTFMVKSIFTSNTMWNPISWYFVRPVIFLVHSYLVLCL